TFQGDLVGADTNYKVTLLNSYNVELWVGLEYDTGTQKHYWSYDGSPLDDTWKAYIF
ncbi:hypothetical protein BgiBS90_019074, partial [Biomphalaria glabrata]